MTALALVLDPNWRDRANCQGTDTEQFYPEQGGRTDIAERICARCDVRTECLTEALRKDERGYWGGTSEHERKQLKKRAKTRQAVAA